MTESVDEHLLTAAKLGEQVRGDLDGDPRLLDHAGLLSDSDDRSVHTFLEQAVPNFAESELGDTLQHKAVTDAATDAVQTGNGSVMSHLVGVTEHDLEADNVTLPARILARLQNNDALCTLLAAGAPNSGKTNTIWLIAEIARSWWSDLLVISNAHAEIVDTRVTSAYDLAVTLLGERERPKMVVIDEGSTHFDARTQSYEVSSQWSPLLKRMSKLSVEVCCVIGHTGKDIDPEMKRLTNLALYKTAPKSAEFFAEWPAESDFPDDRLFGGTLKDLESTSTEYDPDEPAPWSWNLEADLFSLDLEWSELLDELRERGPAE